MTFMNIEIECPFCGKLHIHRIDIAEPVESRDIEVELKAMVDDEMQEKKEEKKNGKSRSKKE